MYNTEESEKGYEAGSTFSEAFIESLKAALKNIKETNTKEYLSGWQDAVIDNLNDDIECYVLDENEEGE